MWPFKKITTQTEPDAIENTIVMARYTEDVWFKLFENTTLEEWKESTHPDNISKFVSSTILNYANAMKNNVTEIIIATIDEKYIEWLNKYSLIHSQGVMTKYIQRYSKKRNYWDDRLLESKMTLTDNMLGLPILIMPPTKKTHHTEYQLSKNAKEELEIILQKIYQTSNVYCPGWIIKGNEMGDCVDDVLFAADHYWKNNSNIRIGKYSEQNYTEGELKDLFAPLLYVIPFVVRANIDSATISLNGAEQNCDSKTLQSMNKLKFHKVQKIEMLELLSNELYNITSIGSNAFLPAQAYLQYYVQLRNNKK